MMDIVDTSTTEPRLKYTNAVRQEVTPCSTVIALRRILLVAGSSKKFIVPTKLYRITSSKTVTLIFSVTKMKRCIKYAVFCNRQRGVKTRFAVKTVVRNCA